MRSAARVLAAAVAVCATTMVYAEIRIGLHVPLSGASAADGRSALEGAKLAVAQANARDGVEGQPIELITYDDQSSFQGAVNAAAKLIDKDRVAGVVSGSYSAPTRAIASALQHARVPYVVAYATHPSITRTGNYVFRISTLGEVQGRAGARLARDLKARRVVLITMKSDLGESLSAGFRAEMQRLGMSVVGEYEYAAEQREFGPLIGQVKADAPDLIYASGYYFTAGPLVRQLRAASLRVPVIGQQGYDSDRFIELAGAAAEGTLVTTSLDRDSDSIVTRAFLSEFHRATGVRADIVAALTYSATQVLIEGLRNANGESGAALRNAITATRFDTPAGMLSFNALHEVRNDVQVQVVRDQSFRRYSVISEAELLSPSSQSR